MFGREITPSNLKTLGRVVVLAMLANIVLLFNFSDDEREFNFRARAHLEMEPELDDRIKIFVMDDTSVARYGRPTLLVEQWADILQKISARQPKAIIVAKLFTLVDSKSPESRKMAIETIEGIDTPIVTFGFVAKQIKGRQPITLNPKTYGIENFLRKNSDGEVEISGDDLRFSELPFKKPKVYAASPDLSNAFDKIGHFTYQSESNGLVNLLYRLGKDQIFPHFIFMAGFDWSLGTDGLTVDGKMVPVGDRFRIPLNYSKRKAYFKRARSLFRSQGKGFNQVEKGDYVYLVLRFYTGSTRFYQSPVGPVPTDFLALPVLNGMLTGEWLTPIEMLRTKWFYNFVILAGIGICLYFGVLTASLLITLSVSTIIVGGVLSFVYYGYEWPWLTMSIALMIASIITLFSRMISIETYSKKVRRALEGLLPPSQVAAVLKDPAILDLNPEKRMVSIMFIDIVGFSLTSQKVAPEEVFNEIKDYLQKIGDIVLSRDGVVDKTLGDGMLCFFGFNIGNPDDKMDHVENAIQCALEIQDLCYRRNMEAAEQKRPVLPLRIGINTDAVIVGNLGGQQRIDITMMGDGVVYASRLETACDPFKIMIGEVTGQQIMLANKEGVHLVSRKIQIKHFSELMDAFEIDPFRRNPEKLKVLRDIYWNWNNEKITESRTPAPEEVGLHLTLRGFKFEVLNYSLSGFLIRGPQYLGRGVTLNAFIDSADGRLGRSLDDTHVLPFLVEVRSGFVERDGVFVMGIRMPGLNDEQKKTVYDAVVETCHYHARSS